MAGMCCGVVGETVETSKPVEPSSRAARRRRIDMQQFKFVAADVTVPPTTESRRKVVQKIELFLQPSKTRDCENAVQNSEDVKEIELVEDGGLEMKCMNLLAPPSSSVVSDHDVVVQESVKFGMTSVCGRRRDMEDAVAIHPSFCHLNRQIQSNLHFFGVYDGHGCSHVAMKCKERMYEIVKDELDGAGEEELPSWKEAMERSFSRMDKEVTEWSSDSDGSTSNCRCELQTPQCDAVGSTAVVAVVTPDKIVVSNCGDSRAVLCRKGVPVPLSSDHKPDRPDELLRIENAGGRVIYWDGPRVLGVLAMSRAIGDNYLKPYVIPEPEVTVTDRTSEDECLILASDGLWDVVSNETACGVARMCLRAQRPPSPPDSAATTTGVSSDKACSDASILLTKLALARHSTDNVSVVVVDLRRGVYRI